MNREEMELIAAAWGRRKEFNERVNCDEVRGRGYAKLLFSKPNFHDPASARRLINELDILDNLKRSSLLYRAGSYNRSASDDLESLIEEQRNLHISASARRIYNMITEEDIDDGSAIAEVIQRLTQMNGTSGDVLAVRGKWALYLKRYDQAIEDLTAALANDCWDHKSISSDLAAAYHEQSVLFYAKGDYQMAFDYIREALVFDDKLEAAILHRSLCSKKLSEQKRPFGITPDSFSIRRR